MQTTKRILLNATQNEDVVAGSDRRRCSYCAKEHETEKCFAFKRLSTNDRWRVVKERAWCYGCLGDGHILPSCKAKRRCAVNGCTRWHHAILHDCDNEDDRKTRHDDKKRKQRRRNDSETAHTAMNAQSTMATNSATQSSASDSASNDVQQARVCTMQERPSQNTLLFRVMPVVLHANGRELQTYALFDEGSSVSLVDERVTEELGMDGPTSDLCMKWFGRQATVLRSRKLTLGISGLSLPGKEYDMNVSTIHNLSLPA